MNLTGYAPVMKDELGPAVNVMVMLTRSIVRYRGHDLREDTAHILKKEIGCCGLQGMALRSVSCVSFPSCLSSKQLVRHPKEPA